MLLKRMTPSGIYSNNYEKLIDKLEQELAEQGDANPRKSAEDIASMYKHHFREYELKTDNR
jgi:hypothetical protein